jgi:hypothetical protein
MYPGKEPAVNHGVSFHGVSKILATTKPTKDRKHFDIVNVLWLLWMH